MPRWCVLVDGAVHEQTDDAAHAIAMAKAFRGDGYPDAKLGKWCACCSRYRTNFAEDRCRVCAATLSQPVPPVVPCREHELPFVAEKQAKKMLGTPEWR